MIDWIVLVVSSFVVVYLLARERLVRAKWHRTQKSKYKTAVARMLSSTTASQTVLQVNRLLQEWTMLSPVSDDIIHQLLEEMTVEGSVIRGDVQPDRYRLVRV